MLEKKRASQVIARQVEVTIEAKVRDEAPIYPSVKDFTIKDETP